MASNEEQMLLPGFGRLQESAEIVLRGLGHRAQLAAVELEELRDETGRAAVLFGASVVAFLLAGVTTNLVIAAIYWDTPHRVTAMVITGVIELIVGTVVAVVLWRRWRGWRPFAATTEQLELDGKCLEDLFKRKER
jgi:uncharacterized membrane protein YqjE